MTRRDSAPPAARSERILVWVLRIAGISMLPAFLATLLPETWMSRSHAWLGLGVFPASAVVSYLARSISLLYGIHGALYLVLSTDIRRYRPLIVFLGLMNVFFGAAMLAIDLHAGMPWYWSAVEGPSVLVAGVVFVVLAHTVPDSPN